jgi:hypothetical protein
MRRFLAVLALGAVIPLAAVSTGWAGDKVDPQLHKASRRRTGWQRAGRECVLIWPAFGYS